MYPAPSVERGIESRHWIADATWNHLVKWSVLKQGLSHKARIGGKQTFILLGQNKQTLINPV